MPHTLLRAEVEYVRDSINVITTSSMESGPFGRRVVESVADGQTAVLCSTWFDGKRVSGQGVVESVAEGEAAVLCLMWRLDAGLVYFEV